MTVERAKVVKLLKSSHLFRGIDDARIETAASFMVPREIASGEAVFQQNDPSLEFFFLFSGRLKVSRYFPSTRQTVQMGFLEEGDYFGQEVLAEDWARQVTVEAEGDAVVLALSIPDFKTLLQVIPLLSPRLQLILDSYRLMLSSRFDWLEPQEFVYYIARKHPYVLLLRLMLPSLFGLITLPTLLILTGSSPLVTTMTILLVAAAAITLGWLIWEYVDWANDYYLITSRRVVYQEKVFLLYDSRQESPLEAVQSTSTSSSQIGRWLGYGNVAVRTYIGVIFFRSVSQPDQVLSIVQQQQLRAQTNVRRTETRYIENLIEKSLGLAPPSPAPAPKKSDRSRPSPLRQFLSEMFHLRMEQGGAVIYRTHWFILLKKILLPSLLLIGLLILVIASLLNPASPLSPAGALSLAFVLGLIIGGWWFYEYLDWHNDRYIISADQVIDVYKKPLGIEQRDAAPIKNILSIEYKRLGLIGLLLNYGTVYIRVGDKQLTFDEVYNPSQIQRELFDRLTAKTYQEKQAAMEAERQRAAEFIAAYHRIIHRNPPSQNPPARGGF